MNTIELDQKIIGWLNRNRHTLTPYRGQYIAYNEEGIMSHGNNLDQVLQEARASGRRFLIYIVPSHKCSITLYPVRLRSVSRHEWVPEISVLLKHKSIELQATMLVDSGADFSVISKKAGTDLGYALADGEQTLLAQGIGGTVEYVLRSVELTINEHSFMAPVAWLQEQESNDEMIIGREVVFDKFDIEFKQAEEKIIFKYRESN